MLSVIVSYAHADSLDLGFNLVELFSYAHSII